eukprot:scaffold305031_cov50-Prasinocladus_malaysianus.AAC.1
MPSTARTAQSSSSTASQQTPACFTAPTSCGWSTRHRWASDPPSLYHPLLAIARDTGFKAKKPFNASHDPPNLSVIAS